MMSALYVTAHSHSQDTPHHGYCSSPANNLPLQMRADLQYQNVKISLDTGQSVPFSFIVNTSIDTLLTPSSPMIFPSSMKTPLYLHGPAAIQSTRLCNRIPWRTPRHTKKLGSPSPRQLLVAGKYIPQIQLSSDAIKVK